MSRSLAALSCLLLLLGVSASVAQSLPPEALEEVKAVKLDNGLAERTLLSLEQLTAHTLKQPDWQGKIVATMKAPFYKRIELIQADPGSNAIFKANKLTAREYMINLLAMRSAWMASSGKAPALGETATPENVAFLKSNPGVGERLAKVDYTMSSALAKGQAK